MKTSNIILLGLFLVILLSITTILFAIRKDIKSCNLSVPEKTGKQTEVQLKLTKFNKLDVEGKFRIHYTQDTLQNVEVKGDSNLIVLAKLSVQDGRLYIKSIKEFRRNNHVDIYLTNDSLNEIKSSQGAIFNTIAKIKSDQFKIEGSEGAVFNISGNFKDLNVNFSTGCVADLAGSCLNLALESNTGSVLNASNLIANNGNISSSTGSVLKINVKDELAVQASTGSVITYSGNPRIKNWNVSNGAVVNK